MLNLATILPLKWKRQHQIGSISNTINTKHHLKFSGREEQYYHKLSSLELKIDLELGQLQYIDSQQGQLEMERSKYIHQLQHKHVCNYFRYQRTKLEILKDHKRNFYITKKTDFEADLIQSI